MFLCGFGGNKTIVHVKKAALSVPYPVAPELSLAIHDLPTCVAPRRFTQVFRRALGAANCLPEFHPCSVLLRELCDRGLLKPSCLGKACPTNVNPCEPGRTV